ncbi:MAG TPA: hypothetical protein VI434_08480, partial [Candidatus Dormibacteraeota bacterium]
MSPPGQTPALLAHAGVATRSPRWVSQKATPTGTRLTCGGPVDVTGALGVGVACAEGLTPVAGASVPRGDWRSSSTVIGVATTSATATATAIAANSRRLGWRARPSKAVAITRSIEPGPPALRVL